MADELNYDPAEHYRLAEDAHGLTCDCDACATQPDDDLGDCAEQMREDSLADELAEGIEENQ